MLACATRAYALDPSRTLTQYVHRIWQVQQGLPEASIYAIVQTRDGYLWLGTQTGLVKFDGVRFTAIDEIDGVPLKDVWITRLALDRSDTLWIGTDHAGIMRLQHGKLTRYSEQGAAAGNLRSACVMPNGALKLPDVDDVQAMLCSSDGTICIGTSDGLLRRRGRQTDRFTTAQGLADNAVLTLAQAEGAIYAGTRNGFSRIRGDEIESFRPQDGLSQSTVYAVYEDREGSLWVATKHGLNQFLDGRSIPYTTSEGLPSFQLRRSYTSRSARLVSAGSIISFSIFQCVFA